MWWDGDTWMYEEYRDTITGARNKLKPLIEEDSKLEEFAIAKLVVPVMEKNQEKTFTANDIKVI